MSDETPDSLAEMHVLPDAMRVTADGEVRRHEDRCDGECHEVNSRRGPHLPVMPELPHRGRGTGAAMNPCSRWLSPNSKEQK
jgi:hypothetical protein